MKPHDRLAKETERKHDLLFMAFSMVGMTILAGEMFVCLSNARDNHHKITYADAIKQSQNTVTLPVPR